MLQSVVGWAVRRPWLVLGLFVLLSVASLGATSQLRLELLPKIAPRQLVVRTEAPGLPPAQVEQLVTTPVERAIAGVGGLGEMRSRSVQGLSAVELDLARGADPAQIRQAVAERLQGVGIQLPNGVPPPQIAPLADSGGPVLSAALTGNLSGMALRELADWTIKPRLVALPGVAQVTVYGGDVRRIEVRGRPGDLADSDLGLLALVRAAERVTSIAGAGFLDTPQQRILVEPHGQAITADQVAQGQIEVPGAAPVRIGDVSDVVEAPAPGAGDALRNGRRAVLLQVSPHPGADPVAVASEARRLLESLAPRLKAQGVELTFAPDSAAERIGATRDRALLAGGAALILLAVALVAALRDARATLVSLFSLLVSLLLTLGVLGLLGAPLNAVTLGGLALGLGVIIDDAVLDVEFALAELRAGSSRPTSGRDAFLRAGREVRGPVFVGALLLIFALAPLLALTGVVGDVLRPVVLPVLVASAVSLAVTASLTPALGSLLMRDARPAPRQPILARLRSGALAAARRCAPLAVAVVAGGAILALLVLLTLPADAVPSFAAGFLRVRLVADPSLSRAAAVEMMGRINRDIQSLPGLAGVETRLGRDPSDPVAAGLGEARMDIFPAAGASVSRLEDGVRRKLAAYPGLQTTVQSRISAAPDAASALPTYSLGILGSDYEQMDRYAARAAAVLRRVPGAQGVRVTPSAHAPVLRADVDFSRLALYGLSSADVVDTVETAFAGRRVATVYAGQTPVDVVVTAASDGPKDPAALDSLLLRSTSGIATPLSRVATIALEDTPSELRHVNGRRMIGLEASPPSSDLAVFSRRARAALEAEAAPPAGITVDYAAADQALGDLRMRLAVGIGGAAAAMLLLLLIAFRNPRTALVVMAAAALGTAGAALAALVALHALNLGVIIGLIAVFGLSTRAAILLLSRIERIVAVDGQPWSFDTVLRAAGDRFTASLLSNLLLILAIAPLALVGGPGGELLTAMAVTLIGGLFLGGALCWIVLPGFIERAWRPLPKRDPMLA